MRRPLEPPISVSPSSTPTSARRRGERVPYLRVNVKTNVSIWFFLVPALAGNALLTFAAAGTFFHSTQFASTRELDRVAFSRSNCCESGGGLWSTYWFHLA